MTFKVICDKCGEEATCPVNYRGDPINPMGKRGRWYSKVKDGKTQHACSRKCLEEIGGLVFPV